MVFILVRKEKLNCYGAVNAQTMPILNLFQQKSFNYLLLNKINPLHWRH